MLPSSTCIAFLSCCIRLILLPLYNKQQILAQCYLLNYVYFSPLGSQNFSLSPCFSIAKLPAYTIENYEKRCQAWKIFQACTGLLDSHLPPSSREMVGALGSAFAAALGSGYIPPGGATTALPLGPSSAPSLNYSASGNSFHVFVSLLLSSNDFSWSSQSIWCQCWRCLALFGSIESHCFAFAASNMEADINFVHACRCIAFWEMTVRCESFLNSTPKSIMARGRHP